MIAGMVIGARKCDLRSFTVENLKTDEDGSVSLRYIPQKTKNSSGSIVEFPDVPKIVLEIFRKNAESFEGKLLPPNIADEALSVSLRNVLKLHPQFNNYIRTINDKGEFKVIKFHEAFHFHCCRASMITYNLSKGMTETMVKRLSGHSLNSTSFQKYVRMSPEVKKAAVLAVYGKFDRVAA
jgi:hypothetical protein